MERTEELQRCLNLLQKEGFHIIESKRWYQPLIVNPTEWYRNLKQGFVDEDENLIELGPGMLNILYPDLLRGVTEEWVVEVIDTMKRLNLSSFAIDKGRKGECG